MEAEREFDFLEGQWDAICRVPSEKGWVEAPGTLTASRALDGLVSLERFEGIYHGGALKGLGLRAFNRESGEWEHVDRQPRARPLPRLERRLPGREDRPLRAVE